MNNSNKYISNGKSFNINGLIIPVVDAQPKSIDDQIKYIQQRIIQCKKFNSPDGVKHWQKRLNQVKSH